MIAAIGEVLGNAVGVAISPIPVIALVLILFSRAAARNSIMFLVGWLAGLGGVGAVVLAVGAEASEGGEADSGGVAKILVGLVLLAMAVRQWRSRPAPGADAEMPSWMGAIDELSAPRAVGLGLLLTVPNPKNLGLTIAAAATISGSGLDDAEQGVVLAVYVFLASLSIIAPVAGYLLARDRVAPLLDDLKAWLIANNATIMAVLLAVLGAKVLGDGIAVLG